MLRIAQINDTHLGLTKLKSIRKMLLKLKEEEFDLLLHCGDYCGGSQGYKTLGSTVRLIREIFPDKPYVTVIGNHDYWSKPEPAPQWWKIKYPPVEQFEKNYNKILEIFKEHKVWFLDEDGPYRLERYVIFGHTGWYANSLVVEESNDFFNLPYGIDGDTQQYMYRRAQKGLYRNLDLLTDDDRKKELIFVSHFPVIKTDKCDDSFYLWSWSSLLGDVLQEDYSVKWFFNGHAHQEHKGPLRWESGSHYKKPKYQIVSIKK